MSITDELRGYADHEAPHYELSKLHAMADRIDAEHGASIIRMNETIRRIVAQGEATRAEVERLRHKLTLVKRDRRHLEKQVLAGLQPKKQKKPKQKEKPEQSALKLWQEVAARLNDENTKLREIAREQRECMAHGNECDGCPNRVPGGGCDAPFWDEYNSILIGEEEDDG